MNSDVLDIENLIQGFKLSCQTEGKSPKTIEWYANFLQRFVQFLKAGSSPTRLDLIDKTHIRAFIRYLQSEAKTPHKAQPLSPATVQGYVRTLKAFFSWATKEEYIQSSPLARVPVPKAPVKVINTFTTGQITKLTHICDSSNGLGYRNLTIIFLLLDSGIRVSELVSIEVHDINLAEG